MRLMNILVIGVMVPGVAAAQAVPPALSTDNAASHMVRAAGMPLRDGALPPGTLTVRIVQGGFSGNLGGQSVQVEVLGGPSPTIRVRFRGLPGRTYEVQTAADPAGPWTPTASLPAGTDGTILFTEPLAPGTRFYRLVEPGGV